MIPGLGRSLGKENGSPFQVFLPRESHGQRNLEGYSPWGCKELDTAEQLTLHSQTYGQVGELIYMSV